MKRLLSKYLHSVCSPHEFEEITAWMVKLENNKTLSQYMKPHWDQYMQKESAYPGNNVLWDKIRLAIEETENAKILRRLKIYTWGIRIAAVIVLGLLTSTFLMIVHNNRPEKIVHTHSITVPRFARTSFTLPDSTMVWLNAGTKITFASDFVLKRSLCLEGEAYFEVQKGDNPFVIKTSLGQVEVTGTAFNVKSIGDKNQFETTVEKGSVMVSAEGNAEITRLTPGTQVRLKNGKLETAKVETDLFTSWKEGKIIFRRAYLPEVAERLENWYNVTIELDKDPRLSKIHYTGTLEMESFSEVLELLKVTAPINYTYDHKTRNIKISHR